MQFEAFPPRQLTMGLVAGGFAITANMLALIMIGKINEKVEPDQRISYFFWGSGIKKRFRELYPGSWLLAALRGCELGLVLSFVVIVLMVLDVL